MPVAVLIPLLPILFSVSAAATEPVYKWQDERGGVHYGQKPPAGVRALPVDTQPNISQSIKGPHCSGAHCESADAQATQGRSPERIARPERGDSINPEASPRGLDFDVYVRLKSGMSEGELLQRAGTPDFQTIDNLRGPIGKSFYYYPTSANPFTTIVTLRGGRILNIERIKKF